MTITLSLTNEEAGLLQDVLTTTLQSLVFQEAQIKDVIEAHLRNEREVTQEQYDNLLAFLKQVAPQRMLMAKVLSEFINDASEQTIQLVESRIEPGYNRNPIDAKTERENWVDAAIDSLRE